MNLKKRLRDFFTLTRKADGGFTLVELVVVIAILAILGGVAVPVYSGYVKKADEAADRTLLSTVNRAFAAACLDNGDDVHHLSGQPILKLTDDKAVDEVSVYDEAFQMYYAGNEDAKFKTDDAIYFSKELYAFVFRGDSDRITVSYGGDNVNIKTEDVEKLEGSTFLDAPQLGIDGLLDKVNEVTEVVRGIGTYEDIISSPDYMRSFLENLGEDVSGLGEFDISLMFDEKLVEMTEVILEKTAPGQEWTDAQRQEADRTVRANMAVLYAAQSTTKMSDTEIDALLNTSDPKSTILAGVTGGDKLGQAALYYGMYMAYAHSNGNSELINAVDNPISLLTSPNLDIEGFKNYIKNTEQGKADLEAYKAAMNIITDSAASAGAVSNLMVNGFNDQGLKDLISSVIGQ